MKWAPSVLTNRGCPPYRLAAICAASAGEHGPAAAGSGLEATRIQTRGIMQTTVLIAPDCLLGFRGAKDIVISPGPSPALPSRMVAACGRAA